MKLGTSTHPKFRRLQKMLKLPQYAVTGLLETVWSMAAQYADDGDITRFSSQEIADYCDWEGDANELLEALVACRWLDRDGDRLVIHDWEDHRPDYITDRIRKREERSAKPNNRRVLNADNSSDVQACPNVSENVQENLGKSSPNHHPTQPNPTKPSQTMSSPNQTKPSPAQGSSGDDGGGETFGFDLEKVDQADCIRDCLQLHKALIRKKFDIDADTLWRWGWLAIALGERGLLSEVATKVHCGEVTKPKGYVESSLRRACTERGKDLLAVSRCVPDRPQSKKPEPAPA